MPCKTKEKTKVLSASNVINFLVTSRLQYTFRWIISCKSRFLGQNIGQSVILTLIKKTLTKTKYWRTNLCFTFMPEVKFHPLIDSPMMLCNQPRRLSWDYTDVKNKLLN